MIVFLAATTATVWSAFAAGTAAENADHFEQASQADQCVHKSCAARAHAAQEISHHIVLEKANETPVQCSHNQQQFYEKTQATHKKLLRLVT